MEDSFMAKDKDTSKINKKEINDLANNIQLGVDDLYSDTYYNEPTSKNDLDNIKKNIDASINNIISRNNNSVGKPSISSIYARLRGLQNDDEVLKNFEDIFNDQDIVNNIMNICQTQRYIKEFDAEIDTIIKYMPKLQEALDTKKDAVLTADTYGNGFLGGCKNLSKSHEGAAENFQKRLKEIKEIYKLEEFLEQSYDNASKYGDDIIYIAPYNKEISGLINNRQRNGITNNALSARLGIKESMGKYYITTEGANISSNNNIEIDEDVLKFASDNKFTGLDVKFNKSMILESAYIEENVKNKVKNESKTKSRFKNLLDINDFNTKNNFDSFDSTSPDGMTDLTKQVKPDELKLNGCIIKRLKRERVIPIYIEDMCLGYYYFEFNDPNNLISNFTDANDPMLAIKRRTNYGSNGNMLTSGEFSSSEADRLLTYLSSELSDMIDAQFINANQDIKKEIYALLKFHNAYMSSQTGQIKVTYIPPDDIYHVYFKLDPITHRGISDLNNSLFAAKLYSCLYITNVLGVLTRSQDKRVYYVKQTVDTNISGTLLNTINQIKKSNFGLREVNSIGQILNITGRYNDYFIPTSQGDPPVSFEVLQGQNIDIKTDLMSMLEEMAVNPTDVPLELIQSRQSPDYATQYVMSNSNFLRKVFKRQSIVNVIFSRIVTAIYNYHYNENEQIQIKLPSPLFLRANNLNNILSNEKDYVNAIAEYEYMGESDETEKNYFVQIMSRNLLHNHVDPDLVNQAKTQARNMKAEQGKAEE
jgi:hypothetical protein